MSRCFLEKRIHIAKKLMKKYLTSILIREMQTKASITYLYPFSYQKLKRPIIPIVRDDTSPHFCNFREQFGIISET